MKRLLTLLLLLAPSGEIQIGELAMKFLRFLVIGVGRLFGRDERTDENRSPFMRNTSIPFSTALVPIHTLKAARVVATSARIALILGMTSFAKILLSIVEGVMVFVIHLIRWVAIKNHLVHKYIISAFGIKSLGTFIPRSIPISLIQPFKIFSIHDCILALCQSNKAVGLVKRLNNRMSFHSAFHWSSMKGLLNFSRYVILFALILLTQSTVFAQNPVSGGPIPASTYTTPPVNANPTHGTGAPSGSCMSGILYTNDSNGNVYACNAGTWGMAGAAGLPTGCTSPGTGAITCTNNVLAANLPAALPTTPNGVSFVDCSTPAGGLGVSPLWCWAGVALNAQTGTTYTIAATDRAGVVTDSNVGATAITLPQAGSTNFANNFNFGLFNINTGLVTITPTTSTINGAATQIVPNKWGSFIYSDPSNNYRALTMPDIGAFPSCADSGGNHLNFTTATGALSCGTSGASAALSALTAAAGTNTLANGNNPQIWNWAQTTNSQSGISFGETSAATNGTLTNGLPNQANVSLSSAVNSTASPFKIAQGQITNTVATPALPVTCSWNNAGLTGICELTNVTDTASVATSLIVDKRVNNVSQFSVDKGGNVLVPFSTGIFGISVTGLTDLYTQLGSDGLYVSGGSRGLTFWSNRVVSSSIDGNISRVGAGLIGVGKGGGGSVDGTMKGAAFLSASTTHALTMPVTIGSGTSIGSTQLCAAADCPAGLYAVSTYIVLTTACGTTGTYVANLIYTDDQGAKTVPVNINGTGAVPATGVLTTTSTANFGENVQVIQVASGNINYSTTAVACGTAGPMVGKLYMVADRRM